MFMSGCNSIVCLNRKLNRRLNVRRTSQWYILMALRGIIFTIRTKPQVAWASFSRYDVSLQIDE